MTKMNQINVEKNQETIIKEKSQFKTRFKTRLGFGAGDMACNFVWQIITIYIAVYYTDVVGLAPLAISTMFLVVRLVDGVTDVLMGIAIDNTKSKYGKSRPWFLWGMIPFCILGILAFAVPQSWGEAATLVYAYITYIGLSCAYTMVNIPLASILPSLTDDKQERTILVSFRMVMAAIGGFAVTLFALPIATNITDDSWTSALLTMMIYSIVAACLFLFTFSTVEEKVEVVKGNISTKEAFSSLKNNIPWMIFLGNIFLMWGSYFMFTGSTYYYYTYVVEVSNPVVMITTVTSIVTGTQLIAALAVPWFAKILKKRHIYGIASIIFIVGFLGIWVSGANEILIILMAIIMGFGQGLRQSIYFSIQADPVDYGEWKTGISSAGVQSAINGFAGKVVMAIAGSLTMLLILDYQAPIDNIAQEQSNGVIWGITFAYIIIPIILSILSAILMVFFYKLDDQYDEIRAELDERIKFNKNSKSINELEKVDKNKEKNVEGNKNNAKKINE